MSFKYWEAQSLLENEQLNNDNSLNSSSEPVGMLSVECVSELPPMTDKLGSSQNIIEDDTESESETETKSNIISLVEVREEKEERLFQEQQIEEFFEEEEDRLLHPEKTIARKIFIDGLLGIPFITVCFVAIGALVATVFVAGLIFGLLTIASLAVSVFTIAFLSVNFTVNIPLTICLLGASLLGLAFTILFMDLTVLFFAKLMPSTGRLCGKLDRKLHLFR